MSRHIYTGKIKSIQSGKKPRVLDLFSGCGGISLGFYSAGFEIVGAIEIDPYAAASHAMNFHSGLKQHSIPRDIITIEPEDFATELGLEDIDSAVDVIVGGPPCQAFARIGRAKLREIDKHPEAYIYDPRGNLYLRYLHYVKAFKPIAIMMENVPDILNYGGHNIAEEIAEVLTDMGYVCKYTLLNAVHYGVPEMRERMFLVAYIKELSPHVFFPKPTNYHVLPRGYEGSRQVALKTLNLKQFDCLSETSCFVQPCVPSEDLPPAVTAKEALGDLPVISSHLNGKLKRGARRFLELASYPNPVSEIGCYGKLMREWHGFENTNGITDHVIRYLPRDYEIFGRMRAGDQYPEAYKAAIKIFNEKLEALRMQGRTLEDHEQEYANLFKSIVPPYDPSKFPNKWRKMEPDAPARTLMAHLGKDSYSHIHYDSSQKRTISVREAARLQSFPDGFRFCGTMNPAFKQIGNAVPPLMSLALAQTIMKELKEDNKHGQVGTKAIDSIRSDIFQVAL